MASSDPKNPKSKNGANGAAATPSASDARRNFLERAMQESSISRIGAGGRFPDVAAPSLDALTVKLEPPAQVTEGVLSDRFIELQYESALRLPRVNGEVVDADDEVTVDTVAYVDGELVPFTVLEGQLLSPLYDEAMPGLREALVGEMVGQVVVVEVEIPQKHPVERFRGKSAMFSVRIVGAAEVEPFEVDSPEFLEAADAGDSVDAVLETLANEWNDEEQLRLYNKGMHTLMEELIARAHVTIEASAIDREIGRRWQEREGRLLSRLQLPQEQHEAALNGWLQNAELRKEVEHGLASTLVLRAVALKEKLTDAADVRAYFDDLAPSMNISATAFRASFEKDAEPETAKQMVDSLSYVRAAELVWGLAPATVEPA